MSSSRNQGFWVPLEEGQRLVYGVRPVAVGMSTKTFKLYSLDPSFRDPPLTQEEKTNFLTREVKTVQQTQKSQAQKAHILQQGNEVNEEIIKRQQAVLKNPRAVHLKSLLAITQEFNATYAETQ